MCVCVCCPQAKFLDFKIQNMVGSCDVKFPIRLEGLVLTHSQFSRFVVVVSTTSFFCVFTEFPCRVDR